VVANCARRASDWAVRHLGKPAALSENTVGFPSRSVGTDQVADTLDGSDSSDSNDQR
jgi:hypothetical protein